MKEIGRRKFLVLFVALLLLMVVFPVLRESDEGRLLLDAMLTILFLAVFSVVLPKHRAVAVALGVPTLLGLWTGYFLPEVPRNWGLLAFHLVGPGFLALCVAVVLGEIHRDPVVSLDAIFGALCCYLLVGLIFAHLYCVVEALAPGSFVIGRRPLVESRDEDGGHYLLTYFSFTTLTTLGYGDIVPVRPAARGLAIVEAIVGQFYLAVLIGELIGKRVSQALGDRRSGTNEAIRSPMG